MTPVPPIRILIADDEPALRGALADLLAHEDSLVLVGEAGDADQAIELAVSSRPDVAIVDVSMPAGGGPRAAREIIRVSPETRVIALVRVRGPARPCSRCSVQARSATS